MKKTQFLARARHLLLLVICCSALGQVPDLNLRPHAQVTAKVTDESGAPLAGAEVDIGFMVPQRKSIGTQLIMHRGPTNAEGVYTMHDGCSGAVEVGANKPGYYPTAGPRYGFKEVQGGKWLPWNPTIDLVMKRIINPIPLYAKRVSLGMPAFDREVAYDLTAGDWVAPFGKGSNRDLIFTAKLDQRRPDDFDYTLTVSFPNPKDGIQFFDAPLDIGSELRSSHHAPEEGYFEKWVLTRTKRPDQQETGNYALSGNRNYYFRVRTVTDEKGKIISTCYGKIYGEFLQQTYYFNPTPNDRNVEFDRGKNLFGKPPAGDRVSAP